MSSLVIQLQRFLRYRADKQTGRHANSGDNRTPRLSAAEGERMIIARDHRQILLRLNHGRMAWLSWPGWLVYTVRRSPISVLTGLDVQQRAVQRKAPSTLATLSNEYIVKFRPFDKIETN